MRKVIAILILFPVMLQSQTKIAIANRSFEDIPRMGGVNNSRDKISQWNTARYSPRQLLVQYHTTVTWQYLFGYGG